MLDFQPDTTVTVKRKGNAIYTHLPVQIDAASLDEAIQLNGESPFDVFDVYTLSGILDIRRGDLLMDEVNQDPDTKTNMVYRVAGSPNFYTETQHGEIHVQRVVGTPQ